MQQNDPKLIPNARQLQTLPTLLILSSIFLVGCASDIAEIRTSSTPTEKTPLGLNPANTVNIDSPQWRVITPENAEEVLSEVEEQTGEPVVFALTESGYRQLSLDLAEIRSHIQSQRLILLNYKSYYEGNDDSSSDESEDQSD